MSWTGSCNQCGACCRSKKDGQEYSCEHLIQSGPIALCAIWSARTHMMPIVMVGEDDSYPERCFPGFPGESETVPEGCSYVRGE